MFKAFSARLAVAPALSLRSAACGPVSAPWSSGLPALRAGPQLQSAVARLQSTKASPPPLAARPPQKVKKARKPLGERDRPHSDGLVIATTSAAGYDTRVLLAALQAAGIAVGAEPPAASSEADTSHTLAPLSTADLPLAEGSATTPPSSAPHAALNLAGEAIYIPQWGPDASESGEVFIFESGTFVTWGLSRAGADAFLRRVIRGPLPGTVAWVERGRYPAEETEQLDFVVGGDAPIHRDTISLASRAATPDALLVRLAYSAGLARVTKLGVYEAEFELFAQGVSGIPALLQTGSEAPVRKGEIIKRVGTLHAFRQKLNIDDESLLDVPEFLWEDGQLYEHYADVCEALDFDTRLAALHQRVDYAFQLQSTLMELLTTKTSHRLEWIIIVLIAFEIALALWRDALGDKQVTHHHVVRYEGKGIPAEDLDVVGSAGV